MKDPDSRNYRAGSQAIFAGPPHSSFPPRKLFQAIRRGFFISRRNLCGPLRPGVSLNFTLTVNTGGYDLTFMTIHKKILVLNI